MNHRGFSRRTFLQNSVITAAVTVIQPPIMAANARPTRSSAICLGGPLFNAPDDPEALARAHRAAGYGAAYCPNVKLDQHDRIQSIRAAFAKHQVVIAEVGRWCNLLDPDLAKRRANLEKVTEGLALADAVGARCCVDIAGSFNRDIWYGPHPDNLSPDFFDAAVENARKIIDAAKPKGARFCYEMMGWALPDSADSYRRMLRAVDRKAFGVHLDPCNLVNSPERFYRNAELIRECCAKLGRDIVSCHAKDLTWDVEMNVHFREVQPGKGNLDYGVFLKEVAALPQRPPLMLEHLSKPEEYQAAREHIVARGQALGLSFI